MQDFFIARQPIFDTNLRVYAYELLFRDSLENVFPEICPNEATSRLIDGSYIGGVWDDFLANNWCFINFTFDSLQKKYPAMLSKDNVVIEILEAMRPGKKLLLECMELKENGYRLALDDYVHHAAWKSFYPLVDIIKIDLQKTSFAEINTIKADLSGFPHIQLLAEKVETKQQFEQCVALNFHYFQGYFFARPEIVKAKTMSTSQLLVLELMHEVLKPTADLIKVAKAIECDLRLTFRLLKYTNSAKFQRGKPVDSIKNAVILLGSKELYRFLCLLFVTQLDDGKPIELARMSLIRGRFCELLSEKLLPNQSDAAFLAGMLSLLDAIFDQPMQKITGQLPLTDDIRQALDFGKGTLAEFIRTISHYEKGHWQQLSLLQDEDQQQALLSQCYKNAMQWADEQLA